ncbi:hypothetical protein CLOSCI_01586 [[Clostridium] scindens ATCC 35704]|nr:hypothetical protein CLOSCI_01586 [[Clostridium] scindens ATCC 35704]
MALFCSFFHTSASFKTAWLPPGIPYFLDKNISVGYTVKED